MSNGIASRILPVAFATSLFLSGCARDRATAFFTRTPAQPQQTALPSNVTAGQKLCPVTGEPLNSMGGAIPVTAMGETIYVCCRGCVKSVNKDPEKYLAIVRAEQ